jgi:hypothetical protein
MPGDVGGFEFFVRRHLLLDEADDMLPEDRLTIHCEVRQEIVIILFLCIEHYY